jgi:hypothetical protein
LNKNCIICGKDFIIKKRGQLCCSPECSAQSRRNWVKKNHNKGWEKTKKIIFEEIKKCVVLCCNCHMELHEGIIELPMQGKRV